jgi:four helix bundle protein
MSGRFRGDMPERTFSFAKSILDLVDDLPNNAKGWTIGKQLVRSGTSIGANIAEADEALTDAEFKHRCSIARKEASETRFWLRLCLEKSLVATQAAESALQEVDEILRILATIIRRMQQTNLVASREVDC